LFQQGLRGSGDEFDLLFPDMANMPSCQNPDQLIRHIKLDFMPTDYEAFISDLMENAVYY
jgi:hypothetical protein